jgi:predicted permease
MQWPWSREEHELDREVRVHIEMLAEQFERAGHTKREALRLARKEFGGVDLIKDQCRDESRWSGFANIGQDLRFGWRMMRKAPAVTAAAVLSLALGIGATTAILSLADAVLWRRLAVPQAEQLVEILWQVKTQPQGLIRSSSGSNYRDGAMEVADFFSLPTFEAFRVRAKGAVEVAGHIGSSAVMASVNGQVLVSQVRGVTGNFFQVLRVQPAEGRLITDADDTAASVPVAVVTSRFAKAHRVRIGQTLTANNVAYTVAGVLPASFTGIFHGDETDMYAAFYQSPQMLEPDSFYRRKIADPLAWYLQFIGRRAPGVSDAKAQAALDTIFASTWEAKPGSPEETPHIFLSPADRGLGSIRRFMGDPVTILLSLVAMVLLVACANIANLLLARGAQREKEIALRMSLGCGRGRLFRQLFTESVLLAAFGGVLSIAITNAIGAVMIAVMPARSLAVEPDLRSLAGASLITLLAVFLFGLYPAWRASRVDAAPALKDGAGADGRRRWAPAKLLVLAQISLGVVLITAAILYTVKLNEIVRRDAGFERDHVLLFDLRPGEIGYKGDRLKQFYSALRDRLSALGGVKAVGLSRTRPMRGGGYSDNIESTTAIVKLNSRIHHMSPEFIDALGVPILAGRTITELEWLNAAPVLLVGEDLARALKLDSAIGEQVKTAGRIHTIVGVVKSARYSRLTEMRPVAYLPFDTKVPGATVTIRTTIPPMAVLESARQVVKELDPNLPLVDIYTMEQQISRTLQRERMFAWICGSFGALALVLCAVGIYGLMSHMTARRTGEIGIRMALGATRADVTKRVIGEGMSLAISGIAIGIPIALYAAHIAKQQRWLPEDETAYGVIAAAIGVLAFSALAAVAGPAIRAASVDPMKALRRG